MKERKRPESLRLRAVMPALTVDDVEVSLAWYRDVMGFVEVRKMEHEGRLVGAVVRAGVVDFLLGQDDFRKGRDRPKGIGFRLYCETRQDIDQLAANVVERGGLLTQEPTDQPRGERDFAVTDPDGFAISVSTGSGEASNPEDVDPDPGG